LSIYFLTKNLAKMKAAKSLIAWRTLTSPMVIFVSIAIGFGVLGCCKCEDDVKCVRGQVVNCVCDCPIGWEGPACDKEVEPKSITITSVAITKMPTKKTNGDTWDLTSGQQNPDLMLILWRDKDYPNQDWEVAWDEVVFGGIKANYDPSRVPITFTLKPNSTLSFPSRHYRIALYDDEPVTGFNLSEDEVIGAKTFIPYVKGSGFPTTLTLSNSTGTVTFELNISYTWPQ
jgi:hypothetical protein